MMSEMQLSIRVESWDDWRNSRNNDLSSLRELEQLNCIWNMKSFLERTQHDILNHVWCKRAEEFFDIITFKIHIIDYRRNKFPTREG